MIEFLIDFRALGFEKELFVPRSSSRGHPESQDFVNIFEGWSRINPGLRVRLRMPAYDKSKLKFIYHGEGEFVVHFEEIETVE